MTRNAAELDRLLAGTPFAGDAASRAVAPLFTQREMPPDTLLFLEGERGGAFAIVAAGRLRAFRQLAGGQELTVFWLRPGDWFGFLPLLDGGPFPVSVASVEPSRVFMLLRDDFRAHLEKHTELCIYLLAHLAERFRTCLDQLGTLGRPGALPRLAAVLASLLPEGERGTVDVEVPMNQVELARTIGVAPENLSRAMSRLVRDGLIRRSSRRRLTVLDAARVRALAYGDLSLRDDRQ
ncbi:MAG: Crp/Fnr family transcriptional regulator [Thermoanaerobaculaceae bacterium]|nr:Crp/Fnr family transcriptional regulator [Thermoanaerobaculaceae bacterium]